MFASNAVRAATLTVGSLALAALIAPAASAGTPASWPQFGDDAAHSGVNTSESAIGAGNVSTLKPAFTASLPGTADGPAVYRAGVSTATGTQDLLFTTTKDGRITASDAHSGTQVWTQQNGPGSCVINYNAFRGACYTTSSPAIDPNGQFVYSYGLDGKAHKYTIGTGVEVTSLGWPQVTTLKPADEKGSSALAIATARNGSSYLYVANGGYPGDAGNYQGHVTTINLATGAQTVFNTLCSDKTTHLNTDCSKVQSAVWARPGITYDAATDKIYFTTGNSTFDGTHNFGDTVLALNADGTGANGGPIDSYTPSNQARLDQLDQDLGSTAPAIVPAPASSKVPNLAVQGGKDAKLRLLNPDNLSGMGGPGHQGGELQLIDVPQGGEVLTQPAAWVNPADNSSWIFVSNGSGISGLKVVATNGPPTLVPQWRMPTGGTSPVLANGVLYYLTGNGARALNPTTGAQLWTDGVNIGLHWQSPIVVNGYLYYPDGNGKLRGYTLDAPPPVSGDADLAVRLDAPVFTSPGQSVTTTVTVSNAGPATASNVTTTLLLPGGFTVDNAAGGTVNGGTLTFTAQSLAPGASAVYSVALHAPGGFGFGFTAAYAFPANPDPFILNNLGLAFSLTA